MTTTDRRQQWVVELQECCLKCKATCVSALQTQFDYSLHSSKEWHLTEKRALSWTRKARGEILEGGRGVHVWRCLVPMRTAAERHLQTSTAEQLHMSSLDNLSSCIVFWQFSGHRSHPVQAPSSHQLSFFLCATHNPLFPCVKVNWYCLPHTAYRVLFSWQLLANKWFWNESSWTRNRLPGRRSRVCNTWKDVVSLTPV